MENINEIETVQNIIGMSMNFENFNYTPIVEITYDVCTLFSCVQNGVIYDFCTWVI